MSSDPSTEPAQTQTSPTATLLFVDDEHNILSSLKRLFRPQGYKILTAESGAKGLDCLQEQNIDLVISDMRMPEMDGATFLHKVAQQWPDTVRILLTGYSDLTSTIDAVNKGRIYRYISKPWEDNDIVLTVQRALEQKNLAQERNRLQALTNKQNAELKALNASLEDKVVARTSELQQTVSFLELAQESLNNSYHSTVEVFSNLIAMREHSDSKRPRHIAEQADKLAEALGMDEANRQQLRYAALLRNLGKLCLKDRLLSKPFSALDENERKQFVQHPLLAEGLLMALEPLHEAAHLIRHQHERVNGSGFPDHLRGEAIPLGARILKVVGDFHDLQQGLLARTSLDERQARDYLLTHRGERYDREVVDKFIHLLGRLRKTAHAFAEQCIKSNGLQDGMVLSRDLMLKDNMLLLSQGHKLTANIIERIYDLEESTGTELDIYIRTSVAT